MVQAARDEADGHAETGTFPPVAREIRRRYGRDGVEPVTQREICDCLTRAP